MRKLSDLLAGTGISPDVLRAARAQSVLDRWPEAVGEILASKCQPDSYDHGVLWVSVMGAAWGQEIRMRREEIQERLNGFAEESLFDEIRVSQSARRKAKRPADP
jgi:hypothetical protein